MTLLALAAAAAVQASGAPSIEITNFAGEVRIEQGETLSVRVERGDPDAPVTTVERADGLVIDGGREMDDWRCRGGWRQTGIGFDRASARPFDEWPLVIITTPDPAAVSIDDSLVQVAAGDLAGLELSLAHCGAFDAGDVAGDVSLGLSGSADVTLGDVGGEADIAISGSSDVTLGDVAGSVSLSMSGSGDVALGDAAALGVRTSGSGDVEAGRIAGALSFSASGSGDLEAISARGLAMRSGGSADVSLGSLEGPLEVTLSGSGDATIGDGRAEPFQVRASGSGGVEFGGTAVDVSVRLSGGGDVRVGALEGAQSVRTSGGGDFDVGG